MGRPSKYAPELRERAVRLVQEHAGEYPSQWAAVRSVAEKLGCSTEALRRWLRQAERDQGPARAQSIAATMCHDGAYAAARRLISADREAHV